MVLIKKKRVYTVKGFKSQWHMRNGRNVVACFTADHLVAIGQILRLQILKEKAYRQSPE